MYICIYICIYVYIGHRLRDALGGDCQGEMANRVCQNDGPHLQNRRGAYVSKHPPPHMSLGILLICIYVSSSSYVSLYPPPHMMTIYLSTYSRGGCIYVYVRHVRRRIYVYVRHMRRRMYAICLSVYSYKYTCVFMYTYMYTYTYTHCTCACAYVSILYTCILHTQTCAYVSILYTYILHTHTTRTSN